MAKIQDTKESNISSSGGYERVFGLSTLGNLIRRVHATSISNGHELEKIITSHITKIEDIDKFLEKDEIPFGIHIARKKTIKKSKELNLASSNEPDLVIFKNKGQQSKCYVIELKDGHAFDTKKAQSEILALQKFSNENGRKVPCKLSIHVCCFNKASREEIVDGFKKKITLDQAMTGQELCELLEIDYQKIVNDRKKDQKANLNFFTKEILKIPEIAEKMAKHSPSDSL